MSKQYKLMDYINYLTENKQSVSRDTFITRVNDEWIIEFDGFQVVNLPKSFNDFMDYQDFIDDIDKSISDLL